MKRTLIAVLASHDSKEKNKEVARVLERLYKDDQATLAEFHFVFTGGTFDRLVLGLPDEEGSIMEPPLNQDVARFLKSNATRLPERTKGGVTILANLIVQRQCSIIWPFLSPITVHWLNPENLALSRLCDVWNAKRLMNAESVEAWFRDEAKRDVRRNPQTMPLQMVFAIGGTCQAEWDAANGYHAIKLPERNKPSAESRCQFGDQVVALIAHDDMKARMVDFAIQYEPELSQFKHILATGTTGQQVIDACGTLRRLEKVKKCLSGPKGGDIEIATEILFDQCSVVVFFIDPLHPHPHIDDIRVVLSACMAEIENNNVRMLTNEVQAREWIEETVRRRG